MKASPRDDLLDIYATALRRVGGAEAVAAALQREKLDDPVRLVAIGKAAAAMARGASQVLGASIEEALVITKHGHAESGMPAAWQLIEADHPVPGADSLRAGRALLEFLKRAPSEAHFLFLVSGGASSLVEVLPEGVGLNDLQSLNRWLLGSGLSIGAMNRVRKAASCIKGGRLVRYLDGCPCLCLLISDVPGDDPAVIGSGLLAPDTSVSEALPVLPVDIGGWLERVEPAPSCQEAVFDAVNLKIVATLEMAKRAAVERGQELGYPVDLRSEFLEGDADEAGARLARQLKNAQPGLTVWGGETTVRLPDDAGRGGRNQHLALAAAFGLAGNGECWLLAAGTDGTDGPTEDAGALVDGGTLRRVQLAGLDAGQCLRRADAGRCLEASGDLVQTGPTGTNVMDLVLGLKVET